MKVVVEFVFCLCVLWVGVLYSVCVCVMVMVGRVLFSNYNRTLIKTCVCVCDGGKGIVQ